MNKNSSPKDKNGNLNVFALSTNYICIKFVKNSWFFLKNEHVKIHVEHSLICHYFAKKKPCTYDKSKYQQRSMAGCNLHMPTP